MPPKRTVHRWEQKHTKALGDLFTNRQADPQNQGQQYIDGLWAEFQADVGNIFHGIPVEKFRNHYREKSATWLTGEAMKGRRRSESFVVV